MYPAGTPFRLPGGTGQVPGGLFRGLRSERGAHAAIAGRDHLVIRELVVSVELRVPVRVLNPRRDRHIVREAPDKRHIPVDALTKSAVSECFLAIDLSLATKSLHGG